MAEFTIAPAITFEILDLDGGGAPGGDGNGDEIFPGNFDTVVLGPNGEAAEYAEFDIDNFVVPEGEVITSVVFEAKISSFAVFGLGTGNDRPEQLGAYGYEGNGQADASDLQLSEQLTSIDTAGVEVGDTISFDVTGFVQDSVADGDSFVGLGVRAEETGGLALINSASGGSPALVITTEPGTPPPDGKKIKGTVGADFLVGTEGNDEIIGLRGDDVLEGRGGSDRFVYRAPRDGQDRILDFEIGTDFLDLSRLFAKPKFSNPQPLDRYVQIIQLGADTAVQVDRNGENGGDRRDVYKTLAILEDTQAADLTSDSFIV